MLEQFRFRDVGPDTSVFGVIGAITSPSPVMHNAAFAAAGIDAVCVPLRASDFADFLTFADAMSIVDGYLEDPGDLSMLIARAERQFEWWTGERPPEGVMHKAAISETGHGDTETRSQHG
jgi:shikimate 5-dehydrogenase